MGHKELLKYLARIYERYHHSDRAHKKLILDEFCEVCGIHRKHAIRLLGKGLHRFHRKKPGRKSRYSDEGFLVALHALWEATDYMCSRKLKAAIPIWLPYYTDTVISKDVREKLLKISHATLDRILKPMRLKLRKGKALTKPGSLLRNQIPIKTNHWDINKPGYMEADTVAHCGNSIDGDFIWSLVLTDIHTQWTECRAVWCKGAANIVEQIKHIEYALPFPLRGFDADNGSEFLNYHLVRYFSEHPSSIQFTRSRPYKKNDNAYVEQKNWTHARQLLGYDRLDDKSLIDPINDLYANEWSLLQNHFYPNMKLSQKLKIGSKYLKKYQDPVTPFYRIMNTPTISTEKKKQLFALHRSLNPFHLKATVERKLKAIFKKVSVTSNVRLRI